MTKAPVTLTYGHGKLYDCTEADVALFSTKVEDGQTLAALASVLDDFFDIEATASGGNKNGYYANAADLGLNTTTYTQIKVRWKCSNANVEAGVLAVFTGAEGTQAILAAGKSEIWKVTTVTLTSGKTLDHIRLYCNAAVGHVYYDFVLVYKNAFSFPNTQFGNRFRPPSRYGMIAPPGMAGAFQQNLGTELAEVELAVNFEIGDWTRTGDVIDGEVFLDIVFNSITESWQWIDLGEQVAQFKVILEYPDLVAESRGEGALHRCDLHLKEFRRSSCVGILNLVAVETYVSRWGLDL